MEKRKQLKFWTGFTSAADIKAHILPLLSKKTTSKKGATPEDRVIWLFMIMWRDLSIKECWRLVRTTYSGSYISFIKLIKSTAAKMGVEAAKTFQFPTIEDWKKENRGLGQHDLDDKLSFIIDGTSLPTAKPGLSLYNRLMYVHYKGHTAFRYFVVTTLSGCIVYLSDLRSGLTTDSTHYEISGLAKELERIYSTEIERGDKFFILGDKGYIDSVPPKGFTFLLTKSADKETKNPTNQTAPPGTTPRLLSEASPVLNKAIHDAGCAGPRVQVERSIGVIKRYARLANGNIRPTDADDFYHDMVKLATFVANLIISGLISVKGNDGD